MTGVPFVVDQLRETVRPVRASLRPRVPGQALMVQLFDLVQPEARSRLFWVLGRSPLPVQARSWYSGVLGEQLVGNALRGLPAPWVVLHSVPIGTGTTDVDHVVLGPPGVFTINTKHHPRQPVWVASRSVLVAGHRQPYIPKAESEAKAAAKLLGIATRTPVPVRPLVVVVGAQKLTVRQAPEHVRVLTPRRLKRWLLAQPAVLSPAQLAVLADVADRPTTWHTTPPATEPPTVLEHRFQLLHRQVRAAQRTRTAWTTGTTLASLGALATLGPEIGHALVQAALSSLKH